MRPVITIVIRVNRAGVSATGENLQLRVEIPQRGRGGDDRSPVLLLIPRRVRSNNGRLLLLLLRKCLLLIQFTE